MLHALSAVVTPAKAGVQEFPNNLPFCQPWMPAFAGMTTTAISLRRGALRGGCAEGGEELGLARLRLRDVALLDVAVAADVLGESRRSRRRARGCRGRGRRGARDHRRSYSAISARSVLRSAVRPKMSSARAAQALQSSPAGGTSPIHPRPVVALLRLARLGIGLRPQRRARGGTRACSRLRTARRSALRESRRRCTAAPPRTRPCRRAA